MLITYEIGHVSNGLAWYINGFLVPELWLRRGLTYQFHIRGGNNPHSAEHYHPLVITDEPIGGYDRLSDAKQSTIRVLAGVEFSLRGKPKPTAGMYYYDIYDGINAVCNFICFSWTSLYVTISSKLRQKT